MSKMNLEDYLPLAEMMKQSFVVHKKDIMARFPKYGDDFLTQFEAKIAEVKALESPYSKLQDQKSVTAGIYADAERITRWRGLAVRAHLMADPHVMSGDLNF